MRTISERIDRIDQRFLREFTRYVRSKGPPFIYDRRLYPYYFKYARAQSQLHKLEVDEYWRIEHRNQELQADMDSRRYWNKIIKQFEEELENETDRD